MVTKNLKRVGLVTLIASSLAIVGYGSGGVVPVSAECSHRGDEDSVCRSSVPSGFLRDQRRNVHPPSIIEQSARSAAASARSAVASARSAVASAAASARSAVASAVTVTSETVQSYAQKIFEDIKRVANAAKRKSGRGSGAIKSGKGSLGGCHVGGLSCR